MEFLSTLVALVAVLGLPMCIYADEGMWLFNNVPKDYLQKKHGFTPDDAWLDHVQKSSVRFNSGGSGSFVSADGLVMTNHHVGADAIQKLSDEKNNYLRDGFFAKTRDKELKCVDLELNVLMSIEDVTERVSAVVKEGMTPTEAFQARNKVIADIEKESKDKTKLRSNVIPLYQGGQYHLYRFKQYTDVRLVFAPEQQAAFFGGDPDNFEYPRYDLDVTFFRVYENDKPLKADHFLKWSANGSSPGELVLVSGHPGRTSRANTVAELEYLRDTGFPFLLQRLYRWETSLSVFSDRSAENGRRAKDELFGIQNSRKARDGGMAGLLDPKIMQRKISNEQTLRAAVARDPKWKDVGKSWDIIAEAEKKRAKLIRPYTMLEAGAGVNTAYFSIARTLLRHAEEKDKPNGERLAEFRDSNADSLEQTLFSEEPIHNDLEIVKLADGLTFLCNELGYSHELVQKVLAGKSPRERAAELITKTKLKDVAVRKRLYKATSDEIKAENEPFIEVARILDAEARKLRKTFETDVEEVKRQAHSQIAKARYAIEGSSVYPDATFTLRLAFGVVKGYEQDGKEVAPYTEFAGMYERSKEHNNKEPFDLPARWVEKKAALDLKTPFNFLCTADIIGGNSGSPVINKKAEVVGLIFDGNIQSLVLDFTYSDEIARAVSVDSRGIVEAMRKIYGADELADELTGKK